MTQHVAHRKSDEIASERADATKIECERAVRICRGLVTAYKMGAGSDYTAGERIVGIATAEWLANEIEGRKAHRKSDETKEEGMKWEPFSTAPSDVVLLLAWYDQITGAWQYEAGVAHNTQCGWRNGRATHWTTIDPPDAGLGR